MLLHQRDHLRRRAGTQFRSSHSDRDSERTSGYTPSRCSCERHSLSADTNSHYTSKRKCKNYECFLHKLNVVECLVMKRCLQTE